MKKEFTFFNCFTQECVFVFDTNGKLVWQNTTADDRGLALEPIFDETQWSLILKQVNQHSRFNYSLKLANNQSVSGSFSIINVAQDYYYTFTTNGEKELKSNDDELLFRLKLISENSNTVTALYTAEGQPEYISPQAEKVYGYTPEEIVKNPPHFGIEYEYRRKYLIYLKKILQGVAENDHIEIKYRHKSGELVWIKLRMNPVFDEQGKVAYIQSTSNDITKRKNYELKLKESERNSTALINATDAAILLIDRSHNIISANDRAKVLGSQLLNNIVTAGDNFLDATPDQYKENYKKFFNAALQGESGQSYRKVVFRNSQEYWFLFKYTPVWESDGSISAVAWMATDITDEKKSEEYTVKVLQRLSLANNAGEIGIWEFNYSDSIMKFDDQCLNLFDKTIDVKEHLPKWAKLYTVQGRAKIMNTLSSNNAKSTKNFDLELQLDQPIGKREYHRVKGLIQYKNGVPVFATGVLLDISKTKLAEKNLETNRNQLLQAQRLAKMGGFEFDAQSKKMTWSENNFELHEQNEQKLPSLLSYFKALKPEDRKSLIEAIRKVTSSNASQKLVLRYKNKVFDYTIKGIFYRNKLHKVVGTVQDITDNVSLQNTLEHKEQLLNENKKRLSEYSFVNSHKVRAPLSNILGLIQLLKIEKNDELFEMLENSAEELDRVIHEVNTLLAE